jgi:O-antigen/teichoic acid export membrane protein
VRPAETNSPPPLVQPGEGGLQNLWSAFAHSVRDNAIAEVAVQILRFGGLIILARALRPADFGLYRIFVVAAFLAMLVNESGIPDALIQRKVLTRTHEATAWWLSIMLAGISATTMYVTAPLVARVMQMPGLTVGLRILCLPVLFEGTAVTANARLRRALRFGTLAVADVVGEAGFLTIALAVLWMGYPRLSLASALGARFAFHALVLWITAPYLPRELPRLEAARDFARFSTSVLGGRLLVILSSNADFLLVGRLLGSSALGLYSMAWDFLRFIPDRLSRVAGRVALPAFCQLQDDNPRLARAYSQFIGHLCRIVLPIVACASIAAPELVGLVYGKQWIPAALPLRILSPGLILLGLRAGIGAIYYTKDHPSFDIYLHGVRLILIVAVVSSTASLGLTAVCIGMSAVEAAISIAGQSMACMLIELSLLRLGKEVWLGLILAAMCGVATYLGREVAIATDARVPLQIALITIPPAVVFAWRQAGDLRNMLGQAFGAREGHPVKLSQERA